jgi:hypothetical protein
MFFFTTGIYNGMQSLAAREQKTVTLVVQQLPKSKKNHLETT